MKSVEAVTGRIHAYLEAGWQHDATGSSERWPKKFGLGWTGPDARLPVGGIVRWSHGADLHTESRKIQGVMQEAMPDAVTIPDADTAARAAGGPRCCPTNSLLLTYPRR